MGSVCAVVGPLATDKLPAALRAHPARFWLTVFLVASGISLALATQKNPRPYLGMCIPEALGLFLIPLAFGFTRDRFLIWAGNTDVFVDRNGKFHGKKVPDPVQWVKDELVFYHDSLKMRATGFTLAIWTLIVFFFGDYYSPFLWYQNLFLLPLTAASAFLAGLGLYAIFGATRMMWRFGAFPVIVKSHKFGVMSTGRVLLECYFTIAFVAAVYYITAVLGEQSLLSTIRYTNPCLLMLVLPTAVFIIVSFVSSQFPLHRSMVEYKKKKLTELDVKLDRLHQKVLETDDAPHDLMETIGIFESRRTEIVSLPEWPFGFKGMLGAVGSSVTVLLPTLVSIGLKLVGPANAAVLGPG